MENQQGHLISAVEPGSIAADLGLQRGDRVLLLDGLPLIDIFDYRLRQLKEQLLLTVRQQGEVIEYDLEKDEDEDLGLSFENPMLQDCSSCDNNCVFCFIDQLPGGMRPSLYFKDDDLRLSFLNGNFATLTNLTDEALDRLINYRFSPMNISVHTTSPELRLRMIRNKHANRIMGQLRRIAQAGLAINCQIVLCPGLNDGEELERTLTDLLSLGDAVVSIALVPVGITRYRQDNHLFPLHPFSADQAAMIVRRVASLQEDMLEQRGTRLVYAADEFYLLAGQPFPETSAYEGFPQLENGVGMAARMLADLQKNLKAHQPLPAQLVWQTQPGQQEQVIRSFPPPTSVWLVTGTAAAPMLKPLSDAFSRRAGCPVAIQAVRNNFFGDTVTVAGLLTGGDITRQLKPLLQAERHSGRQPLLVLPACQFKAGEPILLDDMTLQQLSDSLDVPVWVSNPEGEALVGLLDQVRLYPSRKELAHE